MMGVINSNPLHRSVIVRNGLWQFKEGKWIEAAYASPLRRNRGHWLDSIACSWYKGMPRAVLVKKLANGPKDTSKHIFWKPLTERKRRTRVNQ